MSGTPLLEVDSLEVRFDTPEGTVHAVNGVGFSVSKGETLAVVGESGSGKSVSMLALLGLLGTGAARIPNGTGMFTARSGPINLLDARKRELRQIRGAEIGYVAQDPMSSLNPTISIATQLIETIRTHMGLSKRAARMRAIDLLHQVGIPNPANRVDAYPHEFSGGMRQRVMIAIAIACDPQLVIADEPTTALDVTVQAQIVDLMHELRDSLGLAIIWITHDLGVVAGIADRVAVMYAGTLVETAAVDDVYRRPLHPYSIGLLNALPRIDSRSDRLQSIPGLPPDAVIEHTHCPFANRCSHAFERCRTELPQLVEVQPGRRIACFFDVETGAPRHV
jgi:oligopeptide transport system ATP-binding protein